MKKYRMKATNAIGTAKWNKVKLTHTSNNTTNSAISPAMFKRECEEFDLGILAPEHERYIGESLA